MSEEFRRKLAEMKISARKEGASAYRHGLPCEVPHGKYDRESLEACWRLGWKYESIAVKEQR